MCGSDIRFEVRSCRNDSTRKEIILHLTGLLGTQCKVMRVYGVQRKLVTGMEAFYKMQMHVLKMNG